MNLDHLQLQQLWWIILSLVGALFLFITFVQGARPCSYHRPQRAEKKPSMVNALGRKWELTFTLQVPFRRRLLRRLSALLRGQFQRRLQVWMLILITFVLQAVSFEFRSKAGNLFGARVYEGFLFINGSLESWPSRRHRHPVHTAETSSLMNST
jgi:cytochrome d ubiquinol oxidase subunit II